MVTANHGQKREGMSNKSTGFQQSCTVPRERKIEPESEEELVHCLIVLVWLALFLAERVDFYGGERAWRKP